MSKKAPLELDTGRETLYLSSELANGTMRCVLKNKMNANSVSAEMLQSKARTLIKYLNANVKPGYVWGNAVSNLSMLHCRQVIVHLEKVFEL